MNELLQFILDRVEEDELLESASSQPDAAMLAACRLARRMVQHTRDTGAWSRPGWREAITRMADRHANHSCYPSQRTSRGPDAAPRP